RVGARDVGVLVDHFRFEPQPEFHPESGDVVDQGCEPLRPDVGRDHPVAQPRGVIAPGAEPAVVEHEPFHAERGGAVGQVRQSRQVVVEVDRLPHIQSDGAAGVDVVLARAQVAVEARGHLVEAGAVGGVDPGADVGLVGIQLLGGGELLLPGEVELDADETYVGPWVYASHGTGSSPPPRSWRPVLIFSARWRWLPECAVWIAQTW